MRKKGDNAQKAETPFLFQIVEIRAGVRHDGLMRRRWIVLTLIACAACLPMARSECEAPAPVQPIPFSHKQHMALRLQCKRCHEMPGQGWEAGLPATQTCMSCHTRVKRDSPFIQKLAEFHKQAKPVPWARVYSLPAWVDFSHKEHVETGNETCEACHGPVRERDTLCVETDISMRGCLECHVEKNAPRGCRFCHL